MSIINVRADQFGVKRLGVVVLILAVLVVLVLDELEVAVNVGVDCNRCGGLILLS